MRTPSDDHTRERNPRSLLARLILTFSLVLLSPTAELGAFEFWPLVNLAEDAVWGTVVTVENGGTDRRLVVAVDGMEERSEPGGSTLQLLELAGRSPHATPIRPGSTGLFLFRSSGPDSVEFPIHDGWLVTGGFWPASAGTSNEAVDRLVRTRLLHAEPPVDDALALLGSDRTDDRRLGMQVLRHESLALDAPKRAQLRQRFRAESDALVLAEYLELFLIREWDLAGEGVANLVLGHEDGNLNELALYYLERYGTVGDRAALLTAYPHSDRAVRKRLLEAYGRLQLEDATPWWRDALLSGDSELVVAALESWAQCPSAEATETYELLLTSEVRHVRDHAVRGLATLGTRQAATKLRDYRDSLEPESDEARFVERVLERPYRYTRIRKSNARDRDR